MVSRLAIFNLSPNVRLGANMFGKDVANFDLFRALVLHGGLEQVDFLMGEVVAAAEVTAALVGDAPGAARIATAGLLSQAAPAEAGTLLRGSAKLEELAWLRRAGPGDGAYSLIGMIHTLGPPGIRQHIADASIAPVQPWDALVCTSPSVERFVARMFDEWEAHLRDRFAGARAIRPHLPVIPLGVDQAAMAARADRPAAAAAMRASLGLGADDVLLVWVGRLSFFEKAFPQAMLRAAGAAAQAAGTRVHFAMVGWFPNPRDQPPMYRAAAAALAPDVAFHLIDGNDAGMVGDMWAAADIFLSLVDNIQETFGLTPIEAMACGKPVIVSDWDGYRSTVRDGEDGFLIPTLGGPEGGLPDALIDGHMIGLKSYQQYAGVIAQHTAVHVGRAAEAIAALIRSPALRRRMGEAGRRRVAERFDWRVVAPLYIALAGELGAIRRSARTAAARARHPVHGDPFRDFAGFASGVMTAETRLSLRPGAGVADLERSRGLELEMFAGNWRGTQAEAGRIVGLLSARGTASVGELLAEFPADRRRHVRLSLMWLAKAGIVDWLGGG